MTNSSFAPNLADSGGASEDTFPSLRPPTTDLRPPASARRPSADGGSKNADRLQLASSRNPLPAFVNVNVNEPAPPSPISHLPFPRKRGHAFSLVELLAVVGIIAMLSVAAVPLMRGLGGSQSSRATAHILVSALEQARTAAILSGTNAYLVLPDANFPATNYRFVSYAVLRPPVDLDANGRDDFQTNVSSPNWVLLSKWERLPGDLLFSSTLLSQLPKITPTNLPAPGGSNATTMPTIGFTPGGGLVEPSGTNSLLFASSNKVVNGVASVADLIGISEYSGRVRYIGLTNNVEF